MDYFSLIQLKKEPFSNSPDPDFFYQAAGHVSCLQQVELVIRLRQGLAVVLGNVGTGKTTICRQLIRRLGTSPKTTTHLILDPGFASAREFLETITASFGLAPPEQRETDRQVKERIKAFLFDQAVTRERLVVLLIDEGQKLPQHCIEILRELLNYETNDAKLLQTVIFAQEEFRDQLAAMPNFTDRIACLYHLAPLDFHETREMIRFRIQQASDNQRMMPDLFNLPALFLIWRLTRGYPRKIVMLCSKALLAMIVQNSSRVGARLVLACHRRTRSSGRRWAAAALALLLAAGIFAAASRMRLPAPTTTALQPAARQQDTPQQQAAAPGPAPVVTKTHPAGRHQDSGTDQRQTTAASTETPAPQQAAAPNPASGKDAQPAREPHTTGRAGDTGPVPPAPPVPPGRIGQLRFRAGDSLSKMIARIYGRYTPANLRRVRQANPWLHDADTIGRGTAITFPATAPEAVPADGRYRVLLGTFSSLEAAYALVRHCQEALPPLRVLALFGRDGKLSYLVVAERSFADRASAERLQRRIEDLGQPAQLFRRWERGGILLTPPPE